MTHDELVDFIVEAKRATYASDAGYVEPCRRGAKDLAYARAPFSYLDSYVGERDFSGQEVVWFGNAPVWSMCYHGTMLADPPVAGFIETLRAALKLVQPSRPYRGPKSYRHDGFRYRSDVHGSFDFFHGEETIDYSGLILYRARYHGGTVS